MRILLLILLIFTTINSYADEMLITQGRAITDIENLYECGSRYRKSGIGHFIDQTNKRWIVPALVAFSKARKATDLYNQCANITPASINDVNIDSVPIFEIDHDGEVITGFIFADNYFELYVNGHLVGVDSVPFTPFNSSVVRIRVQRPITYAVRLIDWEENLGLGSENNRGNKYHAGDGGFVASFSDWFKKDFDDSSWPSATVYSNDTIGVNNKPAYMNFSELFISKKAKFIWSSNVVLDNHVIVRKTVK